MIITREGKSFFKFVLAGKTIAINPVSKNSKEKVIKFGSDLALSTIFHPDFNGFQEVSYKDKIPFQIKGPGEYEIDGIFLKGFGIIENFENNTEMVTSYSILFDNIHIAFIGQISSWDKFTDEAFEEFSQSEIFFVPVSSLTPAGAVKFLKQFEPKIIIPYFSNKEEVSDFSDSFGVGLEKMDKFTIKKNDISESKIRIIDLNIN